MIRHRLVGAAAAAATLAALLAGCTAAPAPAPAPPSSASASASASASPAAAERLVCPTRAEVAGLTAIPFTAATSSAHGCTWSTADDAADTATVGLRRSGATEDLAALRAEAIGRGQATRDARALAVDAFTTTTAQACTVVFPGADGAATSVVARRSGVSGAASCGIATAVATLAGGTVSGSGRPLVAVIAPMTLLGAATERQPWPFVVGERAGVRIDRLIGSGYLGTSSASFTRIASGVPTGSAAVVLVSGTAEAGTSSLAVLRAATRALSAAAARAPRAQLVVVGPVGDGSEDVSALAADLRSAARIAGARYVDPSSFDDLSGLSVAVAADLEKASITAP